MDGQTVGDHEVVVLTAATTARSNSVSNPWSTPMAAEPTRTTSDVIARARLRANLATEAPQPWRVYHPEVTS
jgi:hypothetical protein